MICKSLARVATIALLPLLAACGSTEEVPVAYSAPTENFAPVDPSDTQLISAIQSHLASQKGPLHSQYEYVRADLNGDGLREGIVMFNLPHSYWCGWSGCTMAVFEAGNNSFTRVSETSRIRGPIVIGQSKTNGWDDIIVRLSGSTVNSDKSIALRHDGSAYPQSPVEGLEVEYDVAFLTGPRFFP
jgi:hypothetical protein